eukprot:2815230-Pyramimonas_sp.AAC.1
MSFGKPVKKDDTSRSGTKQLSNDTQSLIAGRVTRRFCLRASYDNLDRGHRGQSKELASGHGKAPFVFCRLSAF